MSSSTSTSESTALKKDSSVAIAIVLPCIFAVILAMVVAVAFIFPRLSRRNATNSRDEIKKKRLERLDNSVKAQFFVDWAAKKKVEHPEYCITVKPICVICLDEIEDAAQIRGLDCLHVFHQECLDDWFARCNEYCPLCQRPIVEGTRPKRRRLEEPPPVAFLV
ncbi:hypothetical protein BU24DRAFT_407747 [Aaosphaeria arxii CBS 175.79]|uniref:RING-type domain-containing protein n=1 Tax=Aaosphaeria arxii CBS 175.79 TaxID=1450172 RepID=A0A6A5XXW0_9PLEO|nr:uncharacterized protein BU24DRAFT_407747 [Aaosphaeria arxii CBS 175.79]KAF2017763.1 hypothetical protein BU24DRAFT_407747 [Aaosphaeria arxii CBS 175.79]